MERFWLLGALHGLGRQLCGFVQAIGADFSDISAGLAALWHWRAGDAALVAQAGFGGNTGCTYEALALSRILSGEFFVFDLHAIWREHDERGGSWCDHGEYSRMRGGDELVVFARTCGYASVGGGGLRGARDWFSLTIKK
jgi:hypothetical protein